MKVLMFVPKIKGVSIVFRPFQASCSELMTIHPARPLMR